MSPQINNAWMLGFLEKSRTVGSLLADRNAQVGKSPSAFSPPEPEEPAFESFYHEIVRLAFSSPQSNSDSTMNPAEGAALSASSHTGKIARSNALQRVSELKQYAVEEYIEVKDSSQWDLIKFISDYVSEEDLNIFLLDGGTFHIIKRFSDQREVGVEFLGGGRLKRTVVTGSLQTGVYSASSEFVLLQASREY